MGFTRDELEAARGKAVRDLVGDDVRLAFVGINPGLWTAVTGAHFAHPGNRFYKALHAAGITPEPLDVREGFDDHSRAALTDRGLAITNLVRRATARADELDPEELEAGGRTLVRKLRRWKPRAVAFLGVTAYRLAFGDRRAGVGLQDRTIGPAEVWALPNPSGLNAHYQLPDHARLYREVAKRAGLALGPLAV